MSENLKKVFAIGIFLLATIAIGFILYYVFFRGVGGPPPLPKEEIIEPIAAPGLAPAEIGAPTEIEAQPELGLTPEELEELPLEIVGDLGLPTTTVAQGFITETTPLFEYQTSGATLHSNGTDVAIYNQDDGKFYRINNLGNLQEMTDQTFYDVRDVTWSPDTNKAILEYPDESKIFYNFDTRKQYTLPKNWEEFSFNNTSEKIAFKERSDNADYEWIATANPDGSNKKYIEHMGINADKVIVSWSPNDQIVAMYNEPSGAERSTLYFIGQNDENFKATNVEGFDLRTKWTTDGKKLLYSTFSSKSDYNPELWIVDSSGNNIGENRINLGINTWADKCTFKDADTLYCAIPQEMEYATGLEPEIANNSADTIYRIDLRSGKQQRIGETDTGSSIKSIMVSEDETTLYFVDNSNDELYKIRLK